MYSTKKPVDAIFSWLGPLQNWQNIEMFMKLICKMNFIALNTEVEK